MIESNKCPQYKNCGMIGSMVPSTQFGHVENVKIYSSHWIHLIRQIALFDPIENEKLNFHSKAVKVCCMSLLSLWSLVRIHSDGSRKIGKLIMHTPTPNHMLQTIRIHTELIESKYKSSVYINRVSNSRRMHRFCLPLVAPHILLHIQCVILRMWVFRRMCTSSGNFPKISLCDIDIFQ